MTAVTAPNAEPSVKAQSGGLFEVGQSVTVNDKTGIVKDINPLNGWVTISFDEGGTSPAQGSEVAIDDKAPGILDAPAPVATSVMTSSKKKVKKPEPAPTTPQYPQSQAVKDGWVEANRKLTKDGYALTLGMKVIDAKGNDFIVAKIPSKYSANPNSITVIGDSPQGAKQWSRVSSALRVDHEAEMIDNPAVVKDLHMATGSTGDHIPKLSDGTIIYRRRTKAYDSSTGDFRSIWEYFAVPTTNTTKVYRISQYGIGTTDSRSYLHSHGNWDSYEHHRKGRHH